MYPVEKYQQIGIYEDHNQSGDPGKNAVILIQILKKYTRKSSRIN